MAGMQTRAIATFRLLAPLSGLGVSVAGRVGVKEAASVVEPEVVTKVADADADADAETVTLPLVLVKLEDKLVELPPWMEKGSE
ncbi:hypothetical protein DFQ30_005938 [Apophysomyces sp. BC1015]|nr:hypothetical protein DFQ30_005938 [Apophysomyces sp. BC1015]